jgi:hypothetical protein
MKAAGQMQRALLIISVSVLLLGAARADDKELKEFAKWSIWHEGCRVYADDNSIGNVEFIRGCMLGTHEQNRRAQALIAGASRSTLMAVIRESAAELLSEQRVRERFEAVCRQNSLLENFRLLQAEEDFEGIRQLYRDHVEEDGVRNLLAAVSNEYLGDMIDSIEEDAR